MFALAGVGRGAVSGCPSSRGPVQVRPRLRRLSEGHQVRGWTEPLHLQTGEIFVLTNVDFNLRHFLQSLRKPDNNWEAGIRDW